MKTIQHKFVDFIPEKPDDGVIYITVIYRTAVHNCICGCGNKVVTPLSPSHWKIIFNGKTISLSPSIGNWNFECKSHYWITNNEIRMAEPWSEFKDETKPAIEERRRKKFSFSIFKSGRKKKGKKKKQNDGPARK